MQNRPFPIYHIDDFETFEQLLCISRKKHGDNVSFRTWRRKTKEAITFSNFYDDVAKLTQSFLDIYGTQKKIAILGENSYPWIISYFAAVCSGNVVVPLDKELAAKDIASLMNDCGSKILIYSDDFDDIAEEIIQYYPNVTCTPMSEFPKHIAKSSYTVIPPSDPDRIAAIVYTSGTTGKSKGVMLSQRNICSDTRAACMFIELYGRSLALLPFHHTFAFTVSVLANIYYGVDTLICHSLKNVTALITEFKPTYLAVVPMIVEKVDKGILAKIEKSGKKNTLNFLNHFCKPFDALNINLRNKCFSAIRNGLGGELDFIICGGAPIDQQIIDRFDTYGIKILNGYGISECSPVVSVSRRYHNRAGSIGQALPGINVKINNPDTTGEGEICVQGDIVMHGYYNMPEETSMAMSDGWFHTGDLGRIDKDGFIYITGRHKNLIILSNGKNVAPEELESLIGRIPGVAEVLVYENNNQLVAEIYPDADFDAPSWEYFNKKISELNDTMPPYKAISKVVLRKHEFEKTTTKKIKRINQK